MLYKSAWLCVSACYVFPAGVCSPGGLLCPSSKKCPLAVAGVPGLSAPGGNPLVPTERFHVLPCWPEDALLVDAMLAATDCTVAE